MQSFENNDTVSALPQTDREKARLVGLCADQIKAAVDEAILDIDALSDTVLETARHAHDLLRVVSDHVSKASQPDGPFIASSNALHQAVKNSSTRLQFADRLRQRLMNISRNLTGLSELMQSSDLPITDTQWFGLLADVRARFTMEQERQMFDATFESLAADVSSETAIDAIRDAVLFDGDVRNDG